MSEVIENAIKNYIDSKKTESSDSETSESSLPSDIITVAKEVDDGLDKLRPAYGKLRGRMDKDSSLAGKIEDLMENEVRHIIKPY